MMTKYGVILISQGSAFLVGAIRNNITKAGYDVFDTLPQMKDMDKVYQLSDMIVFYLGNYLEDCGEFLVYLKDLCIENEKELFVIGSFDEFQELSKTIPDSIISRKFERPINIKDLLESLDGYIAERENGTRRKNILVVDDDIMYLRSIHDWLSDRYSVTMMNSAASGIIYLAQNTPDLILLDYSMPVASGGDFLSMIRSEPSTAKIPVFFLTGKSDKETVGRILNLGPNGYLLKSQAPEAIHNAIDQFFEKERIKESFYPSDRKHNH